MKQAVLATAAAFLLSACAAGLAQESDFSGVGAGAPVTDISTPADDALSCLREHGSERLVLGVGDIADRTGRFSNDIEGIGYYMPQQLGDVMAVAIRNSGATLVETLDTRRIDYVREVLGPTNPDYDYRPVIPDGILQGAITALDFTHSNLAELEISGVGPSARASALRVGLALRISDTYTHLTPVAKEVYKEFYAEEYRAGLFRFLGTELVNAGVGFQRREAAQFGAAVLAKLALYEMLRDLLGEEAGACDVHLDDFYEHQPEGQQAGLGTSTRA